MSVKAVHKMLVKLTPGFSNKRRTDTHIGKLKKVLKLN